MQTITKEYDVYEFSELDDKAQEKAYSDWYETAAYYEWWDITLDEFKGICETFGLIVSDIEFELGGRSDGVTFEADYEYKPGCKQAARQHWFELDDEILGIVDALVELQRPAFYQIVASTRFTRNAWPYGDGMGLDIDSNNEYIWPGFTDDADERQGMAADKLLDIFQDLAHWLYKRLDQEYEYLTSMESFLESIEANEWQFTEDGSIF